MIAIIIAGGSGTRLWPLSTPEYPKHLLTVGAHNSSLLQQTYARISRVTDKIYVIPEQSHDQYVREQLPDLPPENCLVEPGRRGTANCTAYGLAHIMDSYGANEPVVILWADHYIRDVDGFAHTIRQAANVAQRESKLVLVGVEPTYAATGFGYIKKRGLLEGEDYVYTVDSFKEKPDAATAEEYLSSGKYLWNSGYFIATIGTLLESFKKYAPELQENLNAIRTSPNDSQVYLDLPSANIDNALIERVPDLLVVPASFDWMDLGSYGDLHQANASDAAGNAIRGNVTVSGVENSFIENHEDKPVAVIGLDNIAVINTKDGILVTRKDLSQAVGDISKEIRNKENS